MKGKQLWMRIMYLFVGIIITLSSLFGFFMQENASPTDTIYKLAQFNPLFATITFFFKLTPQYHGEMWNYSVGTTGWDFPIDVSNVYYNMTEMSTGIIDGFNFTNETQINGGSYLTALHPGIYKVDYSISMSATGANVLYGAAAVKNFDVDNFRSCYARAKIPSVGGVVNIANSCLMDIDVGDTINIQIDDQSPPAKDALIHAVSLNIVKVDVIR